MRADLSLVQNRHKYNTAVTLKTDIKLYYLPNKNLKWVKYNFTFVQVPKQKIV